MSMVGFVTGIYDALNLDIDILMPSDSEQYYVTVKRSEYIYIEDGEQHVGRSFRCRLKGAIIRPESKPVDLWAANRTTENMSHRSNGWVLVTLHHIDMHKRIIVTLADPVSGAKYVQTLMSEHPDLILPYQRVST